MNVTDNTIFITGGGSGIGLALAKAFLDRQNRVIICGRNAKKLSAAKSRYPALHTIQCDIADDRQVEQTLTRLETEFNDLNMLVNNAGILHLYDFYTEANGLNKIEAEINTNFLAPVKLTKRFLPLLAGQTEAAIVNVSSGLAYAPMAGAPVYCATKAALHSWTKSLRYQLEGSSIKVFEVLPPTVDTEMVQDMDTGKISAEALAQTTLKNMARDQYEIRVGQAKALYMMSRLSPALAESILKKA